MSKKSNIEMLRKEQFSASLSLAYNEHLHITRGKGQYLFDDQGLKYLDCVNNVAIVGHANEAVANAICNQSTLLMTNSRYLSQNRQNYVSHLLQKFPKELNKVFLTNSGSEANELALRLSRSYTQRKGIIVLDHAYHGNTNLLIDISPYKHNGPGGTGTPDFVKVLKFPDMLRGPYKRSDPEAGKKYAEEIIQRLLNDDDLHKYGTFIFE